MMHGISRFTVNRNSTLYFGHVLLPQVVDGERFNIQIPNTGIKTHTNPHKKIAYVTLKGVEFKYPGMSDHLLDAEVLDTEVLDDGRK